MPKTKKKSQPDLKHSPTDEAGWMAGVSRVEFIRRDDGLWNVEMNLRNGAWDTVCSSPLLFLMTIGGRLETVERELRRTPKES